MTVHDRGAAPAVLVVITDDPGSVRRWLSQRATATTVLLRRDPDGRSDPGLGHGLRRWRNWADSGWDVIRLPLDGPGDALVAAIGWLEQVLGADAARTVVVLDTVPPPAPELLTVITGSPMTPGVDLTTEAWANGDRTWLPGPGGVAALTHGIVGADAERLLAHAIRVLALLPDPSPGAAWISAVEAHPLPDSTHDWDSVLRARYVDLAVDALAPRPHDVTPRRQT